MDKDLEIKTDIVVIYHAKCSDGFGGAWVAWKKFGDNATYIPATDREHYNFNLDGKEVYIIDYSYPKDVLLELEKKVKKLVIIDHHISAKDSVTSVAEHVFDINNSAAYLTWKYFFPDVPVPKLIDYIEDGDLYRFLLLDARPVIAYIHVMPFDFVAYSKIAGDLETTDGYMKILEQGTLLRTVHERQVEYFADRAELVEFEGYKVYAINANNIVASDLGHVLSKKQGPFAIIFNYEDLVWKCSLRGDGTVDVSEIAGKYGGGGHHNASGFIIKIDSHPLTVFKKIK
jgi:oligoribonuclease NrnB/cAMP/cGMP phosphodiesterase (DHH superfamily)